MDKKQALKILIEHTFILTEEGKNKLLEKLPTLTEEQVQTLGKFFADEKHKALTQAPQKLEDIDKLLKNLDQLELE